MLFVVVVILVVVVGILVVAVVILVVVVVIIVVVVLSHSFRAGAFLSVCCDDSNVRHTRGGAGVRSLRRM